MRSGEQSRNMGFSLIEVIISIAILAIISIPLLSYFTESMKYNSRMAEKQQATMLSQEILEQLNAENPLVQKLPSGAYSIPYLTDRMYTEKSNSIDASGIGTVQFLGLADDIGGKYDVVVTVETDGAADTESAFYGIDPAKDTLVLEQGQLQEALAYFTAVNRAFCSANAGEVRLTADEIQNNLSRDIVIELQTDGSGYRVSVKYAYTCTGLKGSAGEAVTYDCAGADERNVDELNRIYLLYNRVQQTDSVSINRGTGVMAAPDLYLICQNPGAPPYGVRIAGRTYLGDIHTNVEAGHVWDDMGYLITDVKSLAGTAAPVRIAKLQADIYKKGEAEVSGFEPYITVNSMKGE